MVDKKPDSDGMSSDFLLAELMLQVTAMENLLIEKGFFTKEELFKSTEEMAQKAAKLVLERAKAAGNIPEFVAKLEKKESN